MVKSSTSKKENGQKTNAAFSKKQKRTSGPANDNSSKYEHSKEAMLEEEMSLDPADGLLKLFTDGLKDIYWAENHLIKSLPKMARATSLKKLQNAILDHLKKTKEHAERIEEVFEKLGRPPQARKCDAMEGLTKEGEAVIENTDTDTPARDLGIIMASQKVEHYEMASYLGLRNLADNLGYADIADLLSETLKEEEESDALLAEIAETEFSNFSEPKVNGKDNNGKNNNGKNSRRGSK